jgi:hypothetical protein
MGTREHQAAPAIPEHRPAPRAPALKHPTVQTLAMLQSAAGNRAVTAAIQRLSQGSTLAPAPPVAVAPQISHHVPPPRPPRPHERGMPQVPTPESASLRATTHQSNPAASLSRPQEPMPDGSGRADKPLLVQRQLPRASPTAPATTPASSLYTDGFRAVSTHPLLVRIPIRWSDSAVATTLYGDAGHAVHHSDT